MNSSSIISGQQFVFSLVLCIPTSTHFPLSCITKKIPGILSFHSQIFQYVVLTGKDSHSSFKDKQTSFFLVFWFIYKQFRRRKKNLKICSSFLEGRLFFLFTLIVSYAGTESHWRRHPSNLRFLLVTSLTLPWEPNTKICLRNSTLATQSGLQSQVTILVAKGRKTLEVGKYVSICQ